MPWRRECVRGQSRRARHDHDAAFFQLRDRFADPPDEHLDPARVGSDGKTFNIARGNCDATEVTVADPADGATTCDYGTSGEPRLQVKVQDLGYSPRTVTRVELERAALTAEWPA